MFAQFPSVLCHLDFLNYKSGPESIIFVWPYCFDVNECRDVARKETPVHHLIF